MLRRIGSVINPRTSVYPNIFQQAEVYQIQNMVELNFTDSIFDALVEPIDLIRSACVEYNGCGGL